MRIVHFSDTHLGYSDYGRFDSQSGVNQREIDTYKAFREIVDYIIETKPDLVIHAGDLFDSIRPSNRAISWAMEQLFRLSKAEIPIVIIAGNHSTPRQKSTDSIFKVMKYFPYVHPVFEGIYAKLTIGDCAVHAIPHTYSDEDLREAVAKLKPDSNFKYNIMIAHSAVRGVQIASWGEFKEQTIPLESLSAAFDYIALGHYHRFLKIKENAYYCGSPERFSFNEVGDTKGFIDVELDKFSVRQVPTKARDMIVCGPIDCSSLSAAETMRAFESAVGGKVDGKIVKVIFDNIPRHIHSSLDMQKIRDAVKRALHYEPEYHWKIISGDGQASTSKIGSLNEEFENYLKNLTMNEKERKEMFELGNRYLEDVMQEAIVD